MSKNVSHTEPNAVRNIIADIPDGIAIDELSRKLPNIPRRTLQRRLSKLVNDKLVIREGKGPSTRYLLSDIQASTQADSNHELETTQVEDYIPVSPEGEALRNAIRKPIQSRAPVGYNRDFLADYIPNKTLYLPGKLSDELHKYGNVTAQEQPAGTYVRKIFNRLLIDLSWNSSRLEGNTYSLLETERLLELGASADGKDMREAQMILNHKGAIELLAEPSNDTGFNRYTILNLHALLSENLLPDPQASGRIREIAVGVGRTSYHPLEVPQMINDCFDLMLEKATAIQDPFEQAFFIMVHLPYLQPFEDVNKRVSRLAANIPLIRENLCPLSFVDVPQRAYIDGILAVYELNRIEFLRDVFAWAYKRSCARYSAVRQSLGEPDPFRMRYRDNIASIIAYVVRSGLDKQQASTQIKLHADKQIGAADAPRFIEIVETELMSLHEGSIARYRLRPSEYQQWKAGWQ